MRLQPPPHSLLGRTALAAEPYLGPKTLPSGTLESAVLDALPGKKPLIKRSYRPPNYEIPSGGIPAAFHAK